MEVHDQDSYDPPFLLASGEKSTTREIREIWENVVHSAYDSQNFKVDSPAANTPLTRTRAMQDTSSVKNTSRYSDSSGLLIDT